jgi:hypothetical protein
MYANMQTHDKTLASKLLTALLKAGFAITVENGGDEPEIAQSTDRKAIWDVMGEADEDTLNLHKDGKSAGWVYLVYGNGPKELISDYTSSLDAVPEFKALWAWVMA